jgi:hypothetical protein
MLARRAPWQLACVKHIHLLPLNLLSNLTNQGRTLLLLGVLSACASNDEQGAPWDTPAGEDGPESFTVDAALPPSSVVSPGTASPTRPTTPPSSSAGSSSSGTSSSGTAVSSSDRDAGSSPPRNDAGGAAGGGDIDDLIGGLFGDGDAAARPSGDGGMSGEWTLDPDSAEECPPEPPPIPIVGGACLGVYYTCNWRNAAGDTYFCTCDWVHWLCI